jgi:ABC-type glycerol-3-phosphate transport system substrate-binding protein
MGDWIVNHQDFAHVVITNFQKVLTGKQSVEDAMAKAQSELEQLGEDLGIAE